MKKFRMLSVALAMTLGCVPLAACNDTTENANVPENEIEEVLPEYPAEEPNVPATGEPNEPNVPKPVQAKYVYVRSNGLNVRAGAGTAYTSLGTVENDILLKYVGETDGWYETYYKNRTAYVSANSLYTSVTLLDEGESDVENVIEEGLRLMGVPYVYGAVRLHDGKGNFLKGFTVKQFDCSSLMQYIFYQGAGKLLNTTTRTQVSQGVAVAKADIRRGDLLFFTNASRKNNTGIERVGHVALYLGDNYILHTASDYAKVEQISPTRWSYFITARRVL